MKPNEKGSTGHVVVVGSLHLDIVVQAPGRPAQGETLPGTAWWMSPGGKGGNQAVEAARFGASVEMVSRVGDDDFGRRLHDHLQEHRVGTKMVVTDSQAESGMSVAIVEAAGDYGAVIVSGANLRIDASDLESARPTVAAARWVILQNEIPAATNLLAARQAHEHGAMVLWNAAPARPLDPELASFIDLIVVNAVEAEQLTGVVVSNLEEAELAAHRLLEAGFAAVIVTAGGSGSVVMESGQPARRIRAHAIKLVSTHGAGDAYIGALASRLASGHPLMEAAEFANAAAALIVSTPLSERSQIDTGQVERLASSQPPRQKAAEV